LFFVLLFLLDNPFGTPPPENLYQLRLLVF